MPIPATPGVSHPSSVSSASSTLTSGVLGYRADRAKPRKLLTNLFVVAAITEISTSVESTP